MTGPLAKHMSQHTNCTEALVREAMLVVKHAGCEASFTAIFENNPWKCEIWNPWAFFFFTPACERILIKMHSTENRCYRTRKYTVCRNAHASFEPGNLTGWGSEGVNVSPNSWLTDMISWDATSVCQFHLKVLVQNPLLLVNSRSLEGPGWLYVTE